MSQHNKNSALFILPALLVLLGAGCFGLTQEQAARLDTAREPAQVPVPAQPITQSPTTTMTYSAPTILPADQIEGKYIHIQTEKGEIVIELYADTAPLTVSNFVSLAGKQYFDGLTFHRREEGFVIQGGDPSGNGTGGPGYTFADELNDGGRQYTRGTVAMANRGPNTNGSQFFVMLDDVSLPKLYTIFGAVVKGMDIVDQIRIGDEMTQVTIEETK